MFGRKSAAEARAAAGDEVICDTTANCFGITSRGVAQLRGNGCLCLGQRQLVFVQWIPHRKLEIPRERLLKVEQVRSHLGKSKGASMIKVSFTNDQGQEDSAAWMVRSLEDWTRALTMACQG